MIKDVSIEIIQKCVNECIHCSSCSTYESPMILQFDTIKKVICGLHTLGVERICLSGGEPFLHPDLEKIVRNIDANKINVDIYTCGAIKNNGISTSLSMDLLSKIKAAGLRNLIFNFPSPHEETYNLITHSHGHFPLLCESITNAIKCGIRTEIHFVPMKQNINDAIDVLKFAEKLGVTQVNFLKLVPHGRAYENSSFLIPDETAITNLQNSLLAIKPCKTSIRVGLPLSISGSTPPCHAVREKIYIKFDGSVFGCEAFKYITFYDENGMPIAPDNIFDKDIVEIYKNSEYLKQSIVLVKSFENCSVGCENCPVQKYLREREAVV